MCVWGRGRVWHWVSSSFHLHWVSQWTWSLWIQLMWVTSEPLGSSPLQLPNSRGVYRYVLLCAASHTGAGNLHSGSQTYITSTVLTLSSRKSLNSVGCRYSSFTSCQILKGKEELEWSPVCSRGRRKSVLYTFWKDEPSCSVWEKENALRLSKEKEERMQNIPLTKNQAYLSMSSASIRLWTKITVSAQIQSFNTRHFKYGYQTLNSLCL